MDLRVSWVHLGGLVLLASRALLDLQDWVSRRSGDFLNSVPAPQSFLIRHICLHRPLYKKCCRASFASPPTARRGFLLNADHAILVHYKDYIHYFKAYIMASDVSNETKNMTCGTLVDGDDEKPSGNLGGTH